MCFELLDQHKLKAVLTGTDLQQYQLTYEKINYNDADTKSALIHILDRARLETGYAPASGKLFVEIYPLGDGCIIYFTCGEGILPIGLSDIALTVAQGYFPRTTENHLSITEPLIFTFESCDVMITACTKLFSLYCHRVRKSALYYFLGYYRLILYPLDGKGSLSAAFLCEYAQPTGRGELTAAYIAEYGVPIAEENAIDKISYFFS